MSWAGQYNPDGGIYSNTTPNGQTNSSVIDDAVFHDDATWILACSFIIFTMQTGFGLLEAGNVQVKNEVNIMVKNVVDVVFGGLSYWMFGYGLSFGKNNEGGFIGMGDFFMDRDSEEKDMGISFATFVFQLSFATTATTIVSGAMAERTRLDAYVIFSFVNTIIYCVPAHWIWDDRGFLRKMGCVDIAGSGAVHYLGAVSALIAAFLLGPRHGRYDKDKEFPRGGNPTNAMIGMFMLWWGWLAFNCGSTFGISGGKWKLAAKAAVTTLNASMGGGLSGIILTYIINKGKFEINDIVNSILAGLVAVTAGCAIVRPWEAVLIGVLGGLLVVPIVPLMDKLKIDDPVSAVPVHGVGGLWGMLAVGIFASPDPLQNMNNGQVGLIHGGGFYLLGVQALTCLCITVWSSMWTLFMLGTLKLTIGIRLSLEHEILGSDLVEHNIGVQNEVVWVAEHHQSPDGRRRLSGLFAKIIQRSGFFGSKTNREIAEVDQPRRRLSVMVPPGASKDSSEVASDDYAVHNGNGRVASSTSNGGWHNPSFDPHEYSITPTPMDPHVQTRESHENTKL